MINSYYDISKEEEKNLGSQIEKEEYQMERLENEHRNNINAFVNKFKHLEYDHDTFISKTLIENSDKAVKEEENNRHEREIKFMERKGNHKKEIKECAGFDRDDIDKTKDRLEKRYKQTKDDLEKRLNENKQR